MMRPDSPAQRLNQFGAFSLRAALGKIGKLLRIALPIHNCLQDRSPALAENVRKHAANLQIGILQRLLDPLIVLRRLSYQLLATARQIAQLLNRYRWYKT